MECGFEVFESLCTVVLQITQSVWKICFGLDLCVVGPMQVCGWPSGIADEFLSELETTFLQNECHHIAVEIHRLLD